MCPYKNKKCSLLLSLKYLSGTLWYFKHIKNYSDFADKYT